MSTISQDPVARVPAKPWTALVTATEMWASIAISVTWIAVLFAVVYGPDFVSSTPGGESTTIPSGVAVAFFATIATWAIAKYSFGRRTRSTE